MVKNARIKMTDICYRIVTDFYKTTAMVMHFITFKINFGHYYNKLNFPLCLSKRAK